jgi:hypothetical protein
MLSPNPPFASIDYKGVMEEFYKKVPKALAQDISPIWSENIKDIERLFQNSDFWFLLEPNVYDSKFKVLNPLFSKHKKLFEDMEVEIDKDGLSISTLGLFKLFISFEDDSGSDGYR